MKKQKIYIVRYSSGSYEDYFVHDVAAFLDKDAAINTCIEIDDKNFHQTSEISNEIWESIENEYYSLVNTDPNFEVKIPYYEPGGKEEHERVIKYQEEKFIDIIQKYFPEWSREKCSKEKEIKEFIEDSRYRDYSEAWIDELDLY